jgi:hypothetical protein
MKLLAYLFIAHFAARAVKLSAGIFAAVFVYLSFLGFFYQMEKQFEYEAKITQEQMKHP